MKSTVLPFLALALVLVSCSALRPPLPPVDRRDPEAVLRGYFAAWQRGDWSAQASFMDAKYARMDPEPVESLSVVEIAPLPGGSSGERSYRVVFEIKVKGHGVSMRSGRYDWTYYLTWDAARASWLITNYGAG